MDERLKRQSHVVDFLTRSCLEGKMVHGYLFFGGSDDDRLALGKYFACLLLDAREGSVEQALIDQNGHANVILIEPEGKRIKKEQIVFLKSEVTKTALENKVKIYLINGADKMSISATNSLLKFLEEPSDDTYILLLAASKECLLPTLLSRTVNLHVISDLTNDFEVSEEMVDMIGQLEREPKQLPIIRAQNQALFKDKINEFLNAYQLYYQQLLDLLLNQKKKREIVLFDPLLIQHALKQHSLMLCIKKLRAIEKAKQGLLANMNAQLCLDQLFMVLFRQENRKV